MAVNAMDWTYPEGSAESGIFEIGRRLAVALGRAPDVTRFTYDPRSMLRTTREIERSAQGQRLLVGFQTAAKFEVETDRYRALLESGAEVTVWAAGERPQADGLTGIDYRSVAPDVRRLENQWFLVTDGREPLAFVSYELGDATTFGIGGAASPGKQFVGFVSDDRAVVDLLIDALTPIAAPLPPSAPIEPSTAARALVDASSAVTDELTSDVGPGAVLVAVGRGADRDAFIMALALARKDSRELVVVDRDAEGFTSPYSDLRGDDASRPAPERLFDGAFARRDGRNSLAGFLDAMAAAGVSGGGWFPTRAGSGGLEEAARRFDGAVVVLPRDARRPGIAERIRGMDPIRLPEVLGIPVIIAR